MEGLFVDCGVSFVWMVRMNVCGLIWIIGGIVMLIVFMEFIYCLCVFIVIVYGVIF